MKKLVAFLMCVCLIVSSTFALATSTVDLSQISGSDNYDISVNSDSGSAFVTTSLSASERSFTHKYENPNYYSSLESDLLVHDYFGSSPYAVIRTWIYYNATQYLYPELFTEIEKLLRSQANARLSGVF